MFSDKFWDKFWDELIGELRAIPVIMTTYNENIDDLEALYVFLFLIFDFGVILWPFYFQAISIN